MKLKTVSFPPVLDNSKVNVSLVDNRSSAAREPHNCPVKDGDVILGPLNISTEAPPHPVTFGLLIVLLSVLPNPQNNAELHS